MKNLFVRPVLALAVVGAFTTIAASGCASTATPSTAGAVAEAKPASAAVPTLSTAPALPPIDLSSKKLTFAREGAVVTVSNSGTVVATLTLTSATTYTATSAHAVLSIDTKQPLLINTDGFIVYDVKGGENSVDAARKVTMPVGVTTLAVDFSDTSAEPEAIGWYAADGEAVWARP